MFGASCKAKGGPISSENRAHRPGGDGESSQGGVRSLLQGQWGAIIFGEPGAPAWGGRGVQPRGCSEPPARPPSSSENRAHLLGGDGEPSPGGVRSLLQGQWVANVFKEPGAPAWGDRGHSPGGVRSLLQGQWGAIIFREPGAPAWGGRGTQPRGCSEPPARPMGGHHLRRAGRTGVWGTGSPA